VALKRAGWVDVALKRAGWVDEEMVEA